jgi:hypothetical protein
VLKKIKTKKKFKTTKQSKKKKKPGTNVPGFFVST